MKLVSVHVPKSAGFSFQKQLTHLFGKRAIWDYNHTDRPDYKPEKIPPHILAQLRRSKTTVIHGHFFLSKYRHVPGLQRAMWFRDPVQRLLSHYYYWLRAPDMDHPNCAKLHEGGLSVVQFAEIPEMRNMFSRFLDGEPIRELDWVGLVEDYQSSLDLFYAMYAVDRDPRKLNKHENLNPARGSKTKYEIDDGARKAIEKLNTKDMELYYLAERKFEDLIKRYGGGY